MDQLCPTPLLDASRYPEVGGAVVARFCQTRGNATCCLPCPLSDWRYPQFTDVVNNKFVAAWLGVGIMPLLLLLCLTFVLLPQSATDRHYLTTTPIVAFLILESVFIATFSSSPKYCHDAITPNDMSGDSYCGPFITFLLMGCFVLLISCFFRSLSLHFFVCWETKPGVKFKIISLTTTYIGSAALVGLNLGINGAAYQFGKVCYVMPTHQRLSLWIPVLVITSTSLLIQILTTIYCSWIVAKPLLQDRELALNNYNQCNNDYSGSSTGDQRSIASLSMKRQQLIKMRQASMRVKHILGMQWHPDLIVLLILIYSIYLSCVLMVVRPFEDYDQSVVQGWFECLVQSSGDVGLCAPLAKGIGPDETQLLAAFLLLASSGILGTILSCRWRMYGGWVDYLKRRREVFREWSTQKRRQRRQRRRRPPSSLPHHHPDGNNDMEAQGATAGLQHFDFDFDLPGEGDCTDYTNNDITGMKSKHASMD